MHLSYTALEIVNKAEDGQSKVAWFWLKSISAIARFGLQAHMWKSLIENLGSKKKSKSLIKEEM